MSTLSRCSYSNIIHAYFCSYRVRAQMKSFFINHSNTLICFTFTFQFSKQSVVESYVLFIQNFPRAEKALDDISSKSAFQKFVEVSTVDIYLFVLPVIQCISSIVSVIVKPSTERLKMQTRYSQKRSSKVIIKN